MNVSMKDIAEKLGVSVATVSRAFNNDDKVKEETRKKVKRLASKLDYVPSYSAQALKNRKTNLIAVLIPRINSPYYSEITHFIKEKSKEANFDVILCSTGLKTEVEEKYEFMLKSGQVDGAIFVTYSQQYQKLMDNLLDRGVPVVYIAPKITRGQVKYPVVSFDLENSFYRLIELLIKNGHKKIGFAGPPDHKYSAFNSVLESFKLKKHEEFYYILESDFFDLGYKFGDKLARNPNKPTALVCSNDELAISIMQALKENGIKTPGDISITGVDNITMSKVCAPSLTTIDIPLDKMAYKAANFLLDILNERDIPQHEKLITYPSELIIRESIADLNK